MSDLLSQDQIDALLSSGDFGGSGGGGDDLSSDGEPKNYEALRESFDLFGGCASSTLDTLVSRKIELTSVEAGPADLGAITSAFGGPTLAIRIPYQTGLDGDVVVVLSTNVAARLSDLMMMGDGSATFAEEHKDAIGEIFNQITGSFNSAMGAKLSKSLSVGAIDVQEFEPGNPPFGVDGFEMVTMHIGGDSIDEPVIVMVADGVAGPLMQGGGAQDAGDGTELSMDELDDLSGVAGGGGFGSGGSDNLRSNGGGVSFSGSGQSQGNIDMLLDVELDVSIELGRAELPIKRVLELAPGSIVELDRLAGEPVDLLVNNKVVAKGEVVVVDESFGVRIVSLVSPEERIKSLR